MDRDVRRGNRIIFNRMEELRDKKLKNKLNEIRHHSLMTDISFSSTPTLYNKQKLTHSRNKSVFL